ncbi:PREDICTED: vesicle-associated membrane protein 2 isoform X1 [Dinoponera quadriceps]|uniref:Vesicle-associated membrane protein 2 isoform X1 n=1 Tax=Dinoponera quadriceps TaxID=609295 RepID=A0A6P3X252_DINQU|nr:PREDICTED: vesicle-associated membrane protein 2 isoform X1 [Dinoponera quadriceps]
MASEGGLAPDAAAGAGAGTDGIVGGPRTPQQIASQKRLQATQAQVDEVVDIMKTNVEKVLERDQKLSELDDRADALQQGASQFEQQAGKLKRKFWLQNLKMMIIMGVIGLIVLAIIVVKFMPESTPTPPAYSGYPPGVLPGTNVQPAAPGTATGGAAGGGAAGGGAAGGPPQTAGAALVATGDLHDGIRSVA